jgi:endonuclease/exonuclease/phosphatase family metal-dependent hydrolase
MAIKIAAWNVEGRLAGYEKEGRGTAEQILGHIALLDADILILPEAYVDEPAPGVDARLSELGYQIVEVSCEDAGREDTQEEDPLYLRLLSRLPLEDVEYIRPGNIRSMISCIVKDPVSDRRIRVIAVHLDDRTEDLRLIQEEDLSEYINATDMPTVAIGDFNAMWRDRRGRLIGSRIMRSFVRHIPHTEVRFAAQRVAEMATGTTLESLTARTNLREVDPKHAATATPKQRSMSFMPNIRLIQIDHMLVSPDVTVSNFMIEEDGGSDHRAISATITP